MKHAEQIAKIKKAGDNGGKEFGAANALAEFGVLLGQLAEDADQTADKNLKTAEDTLQVSKDILSAHHAVVALTRTLRSLTWGLLIFTVILFIATLVLGWIAHSTDERLRDIYQQYQKATATKEHDAANPKKTEGSGSSITK